MSPKGKSHGSRNRELIVPGPSWRKILARKVEILAQHAETSLGTSPDIGPDEGALRVASLRERRDEKRGGNAAPWKAWKTSKPSFPRNIDWRPFDFVKPGQPFMQLQTTTDKEGNPTVLRFASFPCSILKRSGGTSKVKTNALRAPWTPLPTSPGDAAVFPWHRFPHLPAVLPPPRNRSTGSVAQNLWARREGHPFVVPFERVLISLRKERP
jgi:hypothetical protein